MYICRMPGFAITTSFWHKLLDWDTEVFLVLNHELAHPILDVVLPLFRDSLFWTPLYLFMIAFVFINFGKGGFWWMVAFLSTVAIADLTGTYLFKETVQRLRPCNEPSLSGEVRLAIRSCPGGYSFLSNHAANHFGLATFVIYSFRNLLGGYKYLFYLWAVLISFAQLYVGVHYPLDILGGAVLGVGTGFFTASVYRRYVDKPELVI